MSKLRRLAPLWARARTNVLAVAGFALLTGAAWDALGTAAGLAAGGLSCLILEALTGEST